MSAWMQAPPLCVVTLFMSSLAQERKILPRLHSWLVSDWCLVSGVWYGVWYITSAVDQGSKVG